MQLKMHFVGIVKHLWEFTYQLSCRDLIRRISAPLNKLPFCSVAKIPHCDKKKTGSIVMLLSSAKWHV